MKTIFSIFLVTLLLNGCANTNSTTNEHTRLIDLRAWVVEIDTKTLPKRPSPSYLFDAVANQTAHLIFERRVTVLPEERMALAELTETIYPTTPTLTADKELVPSCFMSTELGITITITIHPVIGTLGYSMEVEAEFCDQLGEEEHLFSTDVAGDYVQSIPRFVTQTIYASGPFEPKTIHIVGSLLSLGEKNKFVLVEFKEL